MNHIINMNYSLQNNIFYVYYKNIVYCIYIYKERKYENYIYKISILNDNLYIFIKNKIIRRKDSLQLKISKLNNPNDLLNPIIISYILTVQNIQTNLFSIGDISRFHYINLNESLNNHYNQNNNEYLNINSEPDINYYMANNSFIKLSCFDSSNNNKIHIHNSFIKYHWEYVGKYHPQLYFKQILYKYRNIILKLKYSSNDAILNESYQYNNTLIFIDDRYDPSFIYILLLFLYSVDESWNLRIYTIKECKSQYENTLMELGIKGVIEIIPSKFNNVSEYSNLLKNPAFWNTIPEENCLFFQYDSFCSGKFMKNFFDYNYLGAPWDHCPCGINNAIIGNGGTSFRKKSIMKKICDKYGGLDSELPEDVFFALFLNDEGLLQIDDLNNTAKQFSFENIFDNNSIYGHQIYTSIPRKDLDSFIYNKLIKMINS